MRVLIAEDEEGIREGLAAFLRHHGHQVRTAASCSGALALVAQHEADVLVTDWRLEDGTAAPLLQSGLPVLVITGCPEEVDAGAAPVLAKPVLPTLLLERLRALVRAPAPRAEGTTDAIAHLPVDVRDRIRLLLAYSGAECLELDDDGTFVCLRIGHLRQRPPDPALLALLGGDWRPEAGETAARWRLYRDGRPAGVSRVIAPGDAWPAVSPFAIDLDGSAPEPQDVFALVSSVRAARAAGTEVHLLNVPSHVRLWLELKGMAGDLPMRACSGPLLGPAQQQLWS